MSKKRIFITIFVFISIASIFYIFIVTRKENPSKVFPKEPSLEQKYKGRYNISLSFDRSLFKFPNKLPLLVVDSSQGLLTEVFAKKIALNLGFSGEPTIIDDVFDGNTYFWRNGESTLFAYERSGKIRYSSGKFTQSINKQLSEDSVLSTAQKYVSDNEIFESSSFQTGKIKYLGQIPNSEGFQEAKKETAVLFQVGILPKNIDYEFISTSSVEPTSYVQINRDGSIYSFQITLFPPIIKGTSEHFLKNYDEILSSLNKAVLIEMREETQLLSDVSNTLIEDITINKIEIAYLIESTEQTEYYPIYKLSGEATLSNSQGKYEATLYLPAISTK